MKAITTHYIPATNTKGARIVADDGDGNRAIVPYPYELSGTAVHFAAVKALCARMDWHGRLIAGSLRHGYAFVWNDGVKRDSFLV